MKLGTLAVIKKGQVNPAPTVEHEALLHALAQYLYDNPNAEEFRYFSDFGEVVIKLK